jgi:hypothetical protein
MLNWRDGRAAQPGVFGDPDAVLDPGMGPMPGLQCVDEPVLKTVVHHFVLDSVEGLLTMSRRSRVASPRCACLFTVPGAPRSVRVGEAIRDHRAAEPRAHSLSCHRRAR